MREVRGGGDNFFSERVGEWMGLPPPHVRRHLVEERDQQPMIASAVAILFLSCMLCDIVRFANGQGKFGTAGC
jgi:hypothetical protein